MGIVSVTLFSNHALVLLQFCMDDHNSISQLYVLSFIIDCNIQFFHFGEWLLVILIVKNYRMLLLYVVSNFFVLQAKLK